MASNWAIVIGINQYRFLQPLKYAKRDAEAISAFLAQEAKFDRVYLFTDDSPAIGGKPTEPFRANLLRVLRQIFAAPFMQDGDNFWFFFSGHGIPHNGQDYLMPLDGDPEDIENTGISTNTITNYLRSCGADNAVMILDACRSGGKKAGEGVGRQTESEARQTGVISLFSCSPDQYSYELEAIAQGAFTHALLEGLGIRGRCATVERLNQYLEHRVPELVSQHLGRVRQTPYTIAEPLNRAHLILMPQHASLTDIATLKNDAYRAQVNQNWDLAQQLWIRVLAAASGRDMDAIEALQRIAVAKASGTIPIQSQPQPIKSPAQPKSSSLTPPPPAPPLEIPPPPAPPLSRGVGGDLFDIPLESEKGIDYTRLRDLLKAGEWKKADHETYLRMLEAVGRKGGDWIRAEELLNFPCKDLKTIDRLWVHYSNGHFGFSVQKKIYVECGAKLDGKYPGDKIWYKFCDRVGWRKDNRYVNYSDLKFNPSISLMGELPGCGGWLGVGVWWFVDSLLSHRDL
ncbi:GUN4 domain-containing protein [Oscillatoria sp. FACHB-1407]|uniref:GUN4 domain-containing protein n=1 Tax=Oscillatoria sp. FACHB-1407 TaxID=2692847 RepID=UPI001682E02F|nr:GUN4 domain-containing protein [Oscillatoria sp. FACHB-1407]MBD2460664.1 GUN4 domain-containing protein [Oscillatoria sp. FACHB-1407]